MTKLGELTAQIAVDCHAFEAAINDTAHSQRSLTLNAYKCLPLTLGPTPLLVYGPLRDLIRNRLLRALEYAEEANICAEQKRTDEIALSTESGETIPVSLQAFSPDQRASLRALYETDRDVFNAIIRLTAVPFPSDQKTYSGRLPQNLERASGESEIDQPHS